MKVTYFEDRPLDGQGTLINPAHKWFREERKEFCDTICKAGNLWYMWRGGFVFHSVDVTKVTKIEGKRAKAICKYYPQINAWEFDVTPNDGSQRYSVSYSNFNEILRIIS
jgi:hypothetical protein